MTWIDIDERIVLRAYYVSAPRVSERNGQEEGLRADTHRTLAPLARGRRDVY